MTDFRESRLRNLLRAHEGSAAIEYAIITGCITALVIGFAWSISDAINTTAAPLAHENFQGGGQGGIGGADSIGDSAGADATTPGNAGHPSSLFMPVLGALISVVAVAVVTRRALKPQRRRTLRPAGEAEAGFIRDKRTKINAAIRARRDGGANEDLLLEHIMDRRILAATPKTARADLESMLAGSAHRHVIIRDAKDTYLGVVSEAALLNEDGETAEQLLDKDLITLDSRTPVVASIGDILEQRQFTLPILKGDAVVGIVTTEDLIVTLECMLQLVRDIDADYRKILRRAIDEA